MTPVGSRPFRLSTALCVSLAVWATACGGTESAAARSDSPEPTPTTVGPIAVSVAEAQGRKVPIAIRANGSFDADEASAVAPQAAGQVVATPVNVGASVRRGDVIVRLQPEDSALRLQEAEAALRRSDAALRQAEERNALAQANAARYLTLVETGDVSKTVADQARTEAATGTAAVATAQAEVEQQRARLALARKAVADVVVRAPFDGVVSERPVAVGEHVTLTTTIATVLNVDPVKLQLHVPGIEAARIRTGLEVVAHVDAYPDRRFTGRITAVNPAIEVGLTCVHGGSVGSQPRPVAQARHVRHGRDSSRLRRRRDVRARRGGARRPEHELPARVRARKRHGATTGGADRRGAAGAGPNRIRGEGGGNRRDQRSRRAL